MSFADAGQSRESCSDAGRTHPAAVTRTAHYALLRERPAFSSISVAIFSVGIEMRLRGERLSLKLP